MISLKELVSGDFDEAMQLKAEIEKINELLKIINPKSEEYTAWENKKKELEKKYNAVKGKKIPEEYGSDVEPKAKESLKEAMTIGDVVMTPNGAGKIVGQKDYDNFVVDVSGNRGIYNIKKLKAESLKEVTFSQKDARDQLADSEFGKGKKYGDLNQSEKDMINKKLGIKENIKQVDDNTFTVESVEDDFSKGFEIEKSEHPQMSDEAIGQLVKDHLSEDPDYYKEKDGRIYPTEKEETDKDWKIVIGDADHKEGVSKDTEDFIYGLYKKGMIVDDIKDVLKVQKNIDMPKPGIIYIIQNYKEGFKEEKRDRELTAKKLFNKSYNQLTQKEKDKVDDELVADLYLGL